MKALIPELLQTDRMTYRAIRADDGPELEPLLLDPRVYRTLHPGTPPTSADVRRHAEAKQEHWQRHGFGFWLLRDRDTGAIIGRGGLQHTDVQGADAVEVAWAIIPQRWGEGLATELAHTSVRLGLDTLALPELVAYTLPWNAASRRVMAKAGFVYARAIVHDGLPHVLYVRAGRKSEP